RAAPCSPATRSRSLEEARDLRDRLAVLQAIGEHAKGEHLGSRERLFSAGPVGKYSWQRDDLRYPAAIVLALHLDDELPRGHAVEYQHGSLQSRYAVHPVARIYVSLVLERSAGSALRAITSR